MNVYNLRRSEFALYLTDDYGVHMWLVDCQVESEQRPHKVSFYVEKAKAEEVIKTLTEKFKERQVRYMTSCLLLF